MTPRSSGGFALALVILLAATPVATAATGYPTTADVLAEEAGPLDDGPVYPYHTWDTLTLRLTELVAAHPDIARLHSAGKSVLGQDLWVVEIADHQDPERVPLQSREVIWLDGGTHANEQLGMMLAYLWVEFLLEEYDENDTATWIVENRHTYIMPMVNPDGNKMDSRWNANGVNINRNYPAGWGKVDENPVFNNPGPYAASEPETRAVVEWIHKVQPDYFNSFHTGVDMMLYPVGYGEFPAQDDAVFARICEELGETDPSFCGPVYSTIYPASGIAVDTAYFDVGAVAWTYEVSEEGGRYWSLEDPRLRLNRYWVGVEHAFLHVEKYGAHPTVQEVRLLADGVVELVVANDGYANVTWADLTVYTPGGETVTVTITDLASGATRVVRFELPLLRADDDGRLYLGLQYPKRLEASPMADRYDALPVEVQRGALVASPIDDMQLSPLVETEALFAPAPAAVLLVVVALLGAVVRRRS